MCVWETSLGISTIHCAALTVAIKMPTFVYSAAIIIACFRFITFVRRPRTLFRFCVCVDNILQFQYQDSNNLFRIFANLARHPCNIYQRNLPMNTRAIHLLVCRRQSPTRPPTAKTMKYRQIKFLTFSCISC